MIEQSGIHLWLKVSLSKNGVADFESRNFLFKVFYRQDLEIILVVNK